jgi:hypothetical protein
MPYEVFARTLCRRIVLTTSDASVWSAVRYLECDPEVEASGPVGTLPIALDRRGDRYRITEPDREPREQLTLGEVVRYLEIRLFELAMEDYPDAPMIAGACLRRQGHRILLIGPARVGTTTLVLRLLLAGAAVEGDAHVFAFGGGVMARPLGLRVNAEGLACVPEIAAALSTAPFHEDGRGRRTYNLDPRTIGRPWEIRRGPVDVVVRLRSNRGGTSSIRPVGTTTAVRDAMSASVMPTAGHGAAVSAIVTALRSARAFDLSYGDAEGARYCVEAACDHAAALTPRRYFPVSSR